MLWDFCLLKGVLMQQVPPRLEGIPTIPMMLMQQGPDSMLLGNTSRKFGDPISVQTECIYVLVLRVSDPPVSMSA